MSLCICDGPPHTYDPSWCTGGFRPAGGGSMRPAAPSGADTLRPPTAQRVRALHARGQHTIAEATLWLERLESDSHWARGPAERAEVDQRIETLRSLIQLATEVR